MHPQNAVNIRRFLTQAKSADEVADWLIALLLVPAVSEPAKKQCLTFMAPTVQGSRFSLEAHRQRFAGMYSHAVMGETLVGLVQLRPILGDGMLGESIFEIKAMEGRIVLPDDTGIEQFYLGQEDYDNIRVQISLLVLAAIQAALPRI